MKTEHISDYALGELHGGEREGFEKELAGSAELQSDLASTTALCDALAAALVPEDELGDARRAKLLADCSKNIAETSKRRNKIVIVTSLAALAACLLIAPMLPWTTLNAPAPEEAESEQTVVGSVTVAENVAPPVPAEKLPQMPAAVNSTQSLKRDMEKQVIASKAERQRSESDSKKARLAAVGGSSAPIMGCIPAPSTVARLAEVKSFSDGWGKDAGSGGDGERRQMLDKDPAAARREFNTESYDAIEENRFLDAVTNPRSTFSIDVDTASYANVRRFLNDDQLPPTGAVRIEELINYFPYNYPQPEKGVPFSVSLETARAPWAPEHELVRIGIRGRELDAAKRAPSNLVFLVDVSGSMAPENKLPLLKRGLRALVGKLGASDRVAIVVYAGASGLALPSTSDKERILAALDRLDAGGSTNGAQGIQLAYETARENFLEEGNNRVILCTDGDFNVGVTSQSELTKLIEKERKSKVFLSVLGFGDGNLKDSTMEKLADNGNGNYAYIDSFTEGRKVLVEQMGGTLFTIAKDVKIQVEFNPARVAGYRLIGYENRLLAKEDFNDDKKDAGEIGAGHTVTALYEIIPAGSPPNARVDPLKYQKPPQGNDSPEILTVKIRYKASDGDTSKLIESPLTTRDVPAFENASPDFQFATAVAAFGMKLRNSPEATDIPWSDIRSAARRGLGEDPGSYRAEFLTLVEKARNLAK